MQKYVHKLVIKNFLRKTHDDNVQLLSKNNNFFQTSKL